MVSSEQKRSGPQAGSSCPVDRALHRLGQDISTARRIRRLSQEDLAQRIGTSLSTVRRMEDGHPGTAIHAFLGALHVLGRLEDVIRAMGVEHDALGIELVREHLPQRVRTPRNNKPRADRVSSAVAKAGIDSDTDELKGF